jgi:ribosomal protein S18 acetylase RimI-like enzyme
MIDITRSDGQRMTPQNNQIIELETVANAAMPALETHEYDGWLLRFSDGYTKRANSVHPLFPSTHDLDEKIAFCAAQYTQRHQPIIYKMTDASQPPELDARLETLGYQRASPTLLQVCRLFPDDHQSQELKGSTELSQEWLEAYQRLDPVKGPSLETISKTLTSIPYPTLYAAITDETGHITAIGQGVLQDAYMGIFAIVVEESQRRRGLGNEIMATLLAWGAQNNAQNAYLQVSADNTKALPLYERLGFRTLYEYWYRVLYN